MLSFVAVPVFSAERDAPSTGPTADASVATKIVCVGAAVAVREASLARAVAVHADAVKAAYATRVNELAGAYSNTTVKTLRAGVKVAWADFNKSIKSATNAWKTSKNEAWKTFKTAVKACQTSSDVSDYSNIGSEISGK